MSNALAVALDSNVVLYARGRQHPLRGPSRAVIEAASRGDLDLACSVELLQEVGQVMRRRGVPLPIVREQVDAVRHLCHVLDLTEDVLLHALDLVAASPALELRDGIHAATALGAGLTTIVTTDRAFDAVDGLTRLDPRDVAAG